MENGLRYILGHHARQSTPQGAQLFSENANPELDIKTKRVTERFSENLHIIANEPSLAYFRIQEHVRKSMPQLVDRKQEVQELQQKVQGSCFDMEYAIKAVKSMDDSRTHFQNTQDLLKNAMFMKQQIQYEQSRREQRIRPSMYRTMLRTQTVDIPIQNQSDVGQADFAQSMQVPANRVEGKSPTRARSSSFGATPKSSQRKK